MKRHNMVFFGLGVLFMALFSCEPEKIEPPLPPPPIRDCSYDFTITAVDTPGLPPPNTGAIETQYEYYERFSINDMCFDPNNPNRIALAFGLDNHPLFSNQVGSVVIVFNLCSNESTTIYSLNQHQVVGLSWGSDDRILLSTSSPNAHIVIVNSDGSDQNSLQLEQWKYGAVDWATDQLSFFLSPKYSVIASHIDLNGQFIDSDLGISTSGFSIKDSMMYYINYFGIYSLNINSGTGGLEDQLGFISNGDIDYDAHSNSIIWCTDSIVAASNLETGQRTELLRNGDVHRLNKEIAVSSNGIIAYSSEVLSLSLSTSAVWKYRTELRFINADGTNERRLVLDFQ